VVDDWTLHPLVRGVRRFRRSFRGTLHAVRDLLFPEYRGRDDVRKDSEGLLDTGFEDESLEDMASRRGVRDWWLARADAAGLPKLYRERPDTVRYGLAVVLGVVMLAALMVMRYISFYCARAGLALLFKLTGNDAYLEGEDSDVPERYIHNAAQAAAYAAEDAARAASRAQGNGPASPGTAASSSRGTASPAAGAGSTVRRRRR
jgi:hypothetical protein